MKISIVQLAILILVFTSCEENKKESYDLIISNANIVHIKSGTIVENQLILISDDTIRKIDDANNRERYTGNQELDASGKYVIPGLWDMHVHFRGGDTLIEENKNLLPLFLAFGITTIRDAGGDITPAVLRWREQIKVGELDGPDIFTSGPKLDGSAPTWPGSISVTNDQEIEIALDSLESLGVDYVKMYDGNLTKEAYYQIIKASKKRDLKTTGHMPLSANFLEAVDYGLNGVEHLYYPLKSCSPLEDSLTGLNIGYGIMEKIIDTYDPQLAEEVYTKMSKNNVFVTPTLEIGKILAQILDVDHSKDTLLPYIGKRIQLTYQGRIEGAKRAQAKGNTMRSKMEEISARMVKPMQEAGVKILAGSDSGAFNSHVYPGESLHGELSSLVAAGLSPQQALETSIINGPAFFNLENQFGSVEATKTAHLLLLNKNPLENIENLSSIYAVVKSGKIYNKELLNRMLAELKKE